MSLTTGCRLGDCVQRALCGVIGALRLVIYEGQEAPTGGGRREAVAAADLAAADVVRAVFFLPAFGRVHAMRCMCRQGAQVVAPQLSLITWTDASTLRHASKL